MIVNTKFDLNDIVTVASNGIKAQVAEIFYRKTINGPAVFYKVFSTVVTENIGPCSHSILPETELNEYIPFLMEK